LCPSAAPVEATDNPPASALSAEPLITIVVPTWNRLKLLEDAVQSVIAQSHARWELIVVDDGSTDGTADRLAAHADERMKVVASPHIGHIGRLRNIGAVTGTGELIAFLDSDDLWLPQKLEVQVKALTESGAGWCYSRFEMMDVEGRDIPIARDKFCLLSGNISRELLMLKPTVRTSTFMVRRDLFDAAGRFSEDPRLKRGEDHELYFRLALRSKAVAITETLVRVRDHAGRTTANGGNPHELMALIYELFLSRRPEEGLALLARRLRARALADDAAVKLAAGRFARAAELFGRSARDGAHVADWLRALARGVRDGVLRGRRKRGGGSGDHG
jgi:glycosyltransferase involved in cell wall biosynthesis